MGFRHNTVATGTNDATKQVSVNAWNADHTLSSFVASLVTDTPAANQADWAPAGWDDAEPAKAMVLRLTPAANSFLGGVVGGTAGRLMIIANRSLGLVCLIDEDVASTAANRFNLRRPALYLMPEQEAGFIYNATASRWDLLWCSLDPMLADPYAVQILPGTGTAVVAYGIATSTTATLSTTSATATPTNDFLAQPFTQITNSTASGSSDVRSSGAVPFMRGATARRQGFFFESLLRITAASATGGAAVGMFNSTAAITTLPDATNNCIFCGIGTAGQTTLRVGARDGTAATQVDLGANFPVPNATAAYQVAFLALPNVANVQYMVRRLDSDFRAQGTLTANLPSNTTALAPRANVMVGATAAATTLQFNRLIARAINY